MHPLSSLPSCPSLPTRVNSLSKHADRQERAKKGLSPSWVVPGLDRQFSFDHKSQKTNPTFLHSPASHNPSHQPPNPFPSSLASLQPCQAGSVLHPPNPLQPQPLPPPPPLPLVQPPAQIQTDPNRHPAGRRSGSPSARRTTRARTSACRSTGRRRP